MKDYPNVYDEVIRYFPDIYKLDDGEYAENNGFLLRHVTMDADNVTMIAEISFCEEYYQFWLNLSEKRMNVVSRTIPGAEKYLWHDEPMYQWERIAGLFLTQLKTHCNTQ